MTYIDAHGIPELNEGWLYEVQALPCRALRVFLDDGTSLVCCASRFSHDQ